MGIIGGALGYGLLTRIAPREQDSGYPKPTAYAGKSKLQALLGERFFDEIRGKVVIDFGCGTGAQAVEMAQHGARRVLGIEIRESLLQTARARAEAAGVGDRCAFMTSPDEPADVVVSLDSFEHFADPAHILRVMDTYLAPHGRVIASFGPTWYHPLGGHLFAVFPWAHLLFTEQALLRWRGRFRPGQQARTITDCGLNKMTLARFERLVEQSPFRFARYEPRPIRGLKVLSLPVLREFGTSVITCTLVKKDAGAVSAAA